MGTGAVSSRGNASWCDIDHSAPPNADAKKKWSHISAPLYAFMAWTEENVLYLFFNRMVLKWVSEKLGVRI
jgi:hypothetical protein